MQLKRFKGRHVPDVVQRVRAELGPEAVILHTRHAPRQGLLRFFGGTGVEIVAAVDDSTATPSETMPVLRATEISTELRDGVTELRSLLIKVGGSSALHPAVAPLYERLLAAGVDDALAFRVTSALPAFGADGGVAPPEALRAALCEALRGLITAARVPQGPRRAVQAFVGPTGAGKTTTLAKLAVRGHLDGTTTRMLSLDGAGLGAGAPLEALSRVLGVPYTLALDPEDLARENVGGPGSGLTLIDTPGLAPADTAGLASLGRLLESLRPSETHLVLSATTKIDDARAAVAAFVPLGVTHLVFTRLDETRSVGSLLGVAVDAQRPLSYFGTGRDVPNDLRPASVEELLRRALEGEPAR